MARKNRVSVYDGVYHVTTRIANRAMLLKPDEVKERLTKWIVSVADFSGVEVWGFTVMDSHLHLIVHVPPVPEEYWLDANEELAAYAFGMRPPECRVPLWNGDSPSPGSFHTANSPPVRFFFSTFLTKSSNCARIWSVSSSSCADNGASNLEYTSAFCRAELITFVSTTFSEATATNAPQANNATMTDFISFPPFEV